MVSALSNMLHVSNKELKISYSAFSSSSILINSITTEAVNSRLPLLQKTARID